MLWEEKRTGLIFDFYEAECGAMALRESKRTNGIGLSCPGGQAYEVVRERLEEQAEQNTSVCWFNEEPVWGHTADGGKWEHPDGPCGRHNTPVPPAGPDRDPMWNSDIEVGGSGEKTTPEEGSSHPCWCCQWLEAVDKGRDDGRTPYIATSNLFDEEWIDDYGAGCSEISDQRADRLEIPRELFKNGRPDGWGEGESLIESVSCCSRTAPTHPTNGTPLGAGCRWERKILDQKPYPIYAFFVP